jgi:hypothetical protein
MAVISEMILFLFFFFFLFGGGGERREEKIILGKEVFHTLIHGDDLGIS